MSEEIVIKIEINNQIYPISCKSGEQDRVRASAELLSNTIRDLKKTSEGISENRLLVMAGLILSDKIKLNANNDKMYLNNENLNELIKWMEKSNSRLNNVARLLDES